MCLGSGEVDIISTFAIQRNCFVKTSTVNKNKPINKVLLPTPILSKSSVYFDGFYNIYVRYTRFRILRIIMKFCTRNKQVKAKLSNTSQVQLLEHKRVPLISLYAS